MLCLSGVAARVLSRRISPSVSSQRRGLATPATSGNKKPEAVQRARDMFAKKGGKGGKPAPKGGPKPALQAAADAQRKASNKANKAKQAGKVVSGKGGKGGSGGAATPGKKGNKGGKGGATPSKGGNGGQTPKKGGALGLHVKTPKGVSKRKQAVQGKTALAVALQGGGSFNASAPRENIRISIGATGGGAGGKQGVLGVKAASRARASALQGSARAARATGVASAKRTQQANARRGLIKPGRDVPAGASANAMQRVQTQAGGQRRGGNKGVQGGRLRQPGIRKL